MFILISHKILKKADAIRKKRNAWRDAIIDIAWENADNRRQIYEAAKCNRGIRLVRKKVTVDYTRLPCSTCIWIMEVMIAKDAGERTPPLSRKHRNSPLTISCNWQISNNKEFVDAVTTAPMGYTPAR